jgi:hypothetical protein
VRRELLERREPGPPATIVGIVKNARHGSDTTSASIA